VVRNSPGRSRGGRVDEVVPIAGEPGLVHAGYIRGNARDARPGVPLTEWVCGGISWSQAPDESEPRPSGLGVRERRLWRPTNGVSRGVARSARRSNSSMRLGMAPNGGTRNFWYGSSQRRSDGGHNGPRRPPENRCARRLRRLSTSSRWCGQTAQIRAIMPAAFDQEPTDEPGGASRQNFWRQHSSPVRARPPFLYALNS
jgi:hypothetical protein